MQALVTQSCPTLWDLMDCSQPGSSLHGILQARILEWVIIHFSRGSSKPRSRTGVSCKAGGFFTTWATREFGEMSQIQMATCSMITFIWTVQASIGGSRDRSLAVAGDWGREDLGVTADGYRVSFLGGNESVLNLDCNGGCINLWIY